MGIFTSSKITPTLDFTLAPSSSSLNSNNSLLNSKTISSINKLSFIRLEFLIHLRRLKKFQDHKEKIQDQMTFQTKFRKENRMSELDENSEEYLELESTCEDAYEDHTNHLFLEIESNIKLLLFFKEFAERLNSVLLSEFLAIYPVFGSLKTKNRSLKTKNSETSSTSTDSSASRKSISVENMDDLEKIFFFKKFSALVYIINLVREFDSTKQSNLNINLELSFYRRLSRSATVDPTLNTNLDNLTMFYSPHDPFHSFICVIFRNEHRNNSKLGENIGQFVHDLYCAIKAPPASLLPKPINNIIPISKVDEGNDKGEDNFDEKETKDQDLNKNMNTNENTNTNKEKIVNLLLDCLLTCVCILDRVDEKGIFRQDANIKVEKVFKDLKKVLKQDEAEKALAEVVNNTSHLMDEKTSNKFRKLFLS